MSEPTQKSKIMSARAHLYRIIYAIEIFHIYKTSSASIKEFDQYLEKLKSDQEEIIAKLKANDKN